LRPLPSHHAVIKDCADKYGNKIKFTKLNTLAARRIAISQKILGLPTITIYQNGEKIEELVKEDVTEVNIEALIARHI